MQWSILRRAFHGHTALVLIGDPKQAIYAFRGADVVTYLEATRDGRPPRHARDQPPQRRAPARRAGDGVRRRRARRRADRRAPGGGRAGRTAAGRGARGHAGAGAGRRAGRAADTAATRRPDRRPCARAGRRATWPPTWPACSAARRRSTAMPVRPGDVAVLVRTNDQAAMVRAALAARGRARGGDGHGERLRHPGRGRLAHPAGSPRAAPAGPAAGRGAHRASSGARSRSCAGPRRTRCSTSWAPPSGRWAGVLHERGVAALLEAVTTDTALPGPPARPHRRRAMAHRPAARRAGAARASPSTAHLGPGALDRVAAAAHRRGRRSTSGWSAADGWSPTPPPCRSSRSTAARAWSSPSSTCRSGGTATCAIPDVPLLHVGTDRVRDVGGESGEGCPRALRGAPGRGGRRGSPAALRGAHQGEVPGRHVVGAVHHHRDVAGAPTADRAAQRRAREPAASYRVPSDEAAWAALRGLASPVLAVERVARARPGAGRRPRSRYRRAATPRRRIGGGRRSPARWTGSGGAPPTRRSPRARATTRAG